MFPKSMSLILQMRIQSKLKENKIIIKHSGYICFKSVLLIIILVRIF